MKNKSWIKRSCSQNFIRTVLNSVNNEIKYSKAICVNSYDKYKPEGKEKIAYDNYINSNKIFPESKAISLFSGMLRSHSFGKCMKCGNEYDNYSFSYFIDQNMYLDSIYKTSYFSKVIKENITCSNAIMDCDKCKTKNGFQIQEESKIVKLPDILIFTLERYLDGTNKTQIKPDNKIYLDDYIDPRLKGEKTEYELFAINIRFGGTKNFGHEICQIKINETWYEFNDRQASLKKYEYYDCSYGLFYKRI